MKESDEVIFCEFVEASFGKYHKVPIKIAKIIFNGKPAFIYSNGPGFPSTKGFIKAGDKLDANTKIAYFAANGEDIPYDRPYAVIGLE